MVDFYAQLFCIFGIERVLGVDKSAHAAFLLRLRNDVEGKRGLAGALRPENLDDAPARQAADAERPIDPDGAGRNGVDVHLRLRAEHHDALIAEFRFYLRERSLDILV